MRVWAATLACAFCLLVWTGQSWPQSPFKAGPDKQAQTVQEDFGFMDRALMQLNLWQRQINQRMSQLSREVEQTGSVRPVLFLLGLALLYGLLHAAGPGHGKLVALSYAVSRDRLSAALAVGNLTALVHGLSGITMVLVVKFLLDTSMRGALASTTQTTQIISYALVALLGALLLGRALWSWREKRGQSKALKRDVPPWLMALAAGIVPCPGVVLIMLFCLAQGMTWLGVLMALAMSLGMALTISAVAAAAYAGKSVSLKAASISSKKVQWAERILESGAALLLMVFGLLFLAASINGGGLRSI
jgi:nickel/cobalt exporter